MTTPERKGWDTSRRVVPSDWTRRRAACMREHQGVCHVCHLPGADEVDHVIPVARGGSHEPENLRPIHREPCHREKTRAESNEGRALRSRRRPTGQHPGLKW